MLSLDQLSIRAKLRNQRFLVSKLFPVESGSHLCPRNYTQRTTCPLSFTPVTQQNEEEGGLLAPSRAPCQPFPWSLWRWIKLCISSTPMPAISNITQILTSMPGYFMRKDNRLYNVEKAINLPLGYEMQNVLKGGMGESLHIFQVRYVFSCFVGKKKAFDH